MRVVRNFSVTQRGVGRPDYTPAVVSSKASIVDNQEKWSLLVTRRAAEGNALPPGSETITIPATTLGNVNGWQLNVGGGTIVCNVSGIQKVAIYQIIGDFLYDIRGDIIFGPLSSPIISPDDSMIIYLYNLDVADRDFSISLVGVLEKTE